MKKFWCSIYVLNLLFSGGIFILAANCKVNKNIEITAFTILYGINFLGTFIDACLCKHFWHNIWHLVVGLVIVPVLLVIVSSTSENSLLVPTQKWISIATVMTVIYYITMRRLQKVEYIFFFVIFMLHTAGFSLALYKQIHSLIAVLTTFFFQIWHAWFCNQKYYVDVRLKMNKGGVGKSEYIAHSYLLWGMTTVVALDYLQTNACGDIYEDILWAAEGFVYTLYATFAIFTYLMYNWERKNEIIAQNEEEQQEFAISGGSDDENEI